MERIFRFKHAIRFIIPVITRFVFQQLYEKNLCYALKPMNLEYVVAEQGLFVKMNTLPSYHQHTDAMDYVCIIWSLLQA